MGYNLLINGVYWGYNPLTNHLLTSWDIQANHLKVGTEVTFQRFFSQTCGDVFLDPISPNGKCLFEHSKSHTIHVWYIYPHEWLIFMIHVGKYTSPMDPMGNIGVLNGFRAIHKINDHWLRRCVVILVDDAWRLSTGKPRAILWSP